VVLKPAATTAPVAAVAASQLSAAGAVAQPTRVWTNALQGYAAPMTSSQAAGGCQAAADPAGPHTGPGGHHVAEHGHTQPHLGHRPALRVLLLHPRYAQPAAVHQPM